MNFELRVALYLQLLKRNFVEKARGDGRHTGLDVSKGKKLLGYNPQVSLVEGLTEEWKWIQGWY